MKISTLLFISIIALLILSACNTNGAAVKCQTVEKADQTQCYIDVAIETKDISVCNSAEGRSENWCRFEASKALDLLEGCESLNGDVYWENICYKYFGENHADPELCNKVENKQSNQECLVNIAVDTGNPNVCKEIEVSIQEDNTQKEKCYYDSSIASLNPLNCDRLENPINRDTCVSKIARAKDDPELCNAIKLDEIEKGCIERFKLNNLEAQEENATLD